MPKESEMYGLSKDDCKESILIGGTGYMDSSSSLAHSSACYKLSSNSNMCASSAPNFVYKRRKLHSNSMSLLSTNESDSAKGGNNFHVNMGSKDDSSGHTEKETEKHGTSTTGVCNGDFICNGRTSISGQLHPHDHENVLCMNIENTKGVEDVSKSESLDGYAREEQHIDEARDNKSNTGYCSGNNSSSSSKSNVELASTAVPIVIEDTGECSSSDFLSAGNLSEKEVCISILKSHGLLRRGVSIRTHGSTDGPEITANRTRSLFCAICGHMENPDNMLICDDCEEAFHLSCFNPKIKKIPDYEWYCISCSSKRHKFSLESAPVKSVKIKSEGSERRNRAYKSTSIDAMLRDSESYTTNVRIGKSFQADVPEWSGPISEESDCFGEPLELDPTECGSLKEWSNARNANRLSTPTVGNWLQCREVLDDSSGESEAGTICGKWRRAPLFEVQTDNWDCSCSVLWDPIHSDCAVPQELETDQVLMHLKYIQLLRPKLAKRKVSEPKSSETDGARDVKPKEGGVP